MTERYHWGVILCFAAISLSAADNPTVNAYRPWRAEKDEFRCDTEGKQTSLHLSVNVEKEGCYRLSWKMKSSLSRDRNIMLLYPSWNDKYQCAANEYMVNEVWTEYASWIYSGRSAGTEKISMSFKLDSPQQLSVKDIALTLADGESLADPLRDSIPAQGKNSPVWSVYQTAAGQEPWPMQCIADDSSLDGRAIRFAASKTQNTMRSIFLPVRPGTQYRFEFWVKASKPLRLRISANNWFNPHRDNDKRPDKGRWSKSFNQTADEQWRKISILLAIPSDMEEYPDFQARMIRLFVGTESDDATLWYSGLSFKEEK